MREVEQGEFSRADIAAATEVHRALGLVSLETVYEEAFCVELQVRDIPFARQVPVAISYKGKEVGQGRLDLLVGNSVVVELKAADALSGLHEAQLLSYLKTTGYRTGLLINFNVTILRDGIKRLVC